MDCSLFVRSASDIVTLKKLIGIKNKVTRVIAKIEKPEAIADIDGIIEMADGIMVARGDLGVEIPFDKVPVAKPSSIVPQVYLCRAPSETVSSQIDWQSSISPRSKKQLQHSFHSGQSN